MKISTVCRVGAKKALTDYFKQKGAITARGKILKDSIVYQVHTELKKMLFDAYGLDRDIIDEDSRADYIQWKFDALDEIDAVSGRYTPYNLKYRRDFDNDATLTPVDLVKKYVTVDGGPAGLKIMRYTDWTAEEVSKFKAGMRTVYPNIIVTPIQTKLSGGQAKYSIQLTKTPQPNVTPIVSDEQANPVDLYNEREMQIVTDAIEPLLKAFKNVRVNWVTESELRKMLKDKKPKVIATKGLTITGVAVGRDVYLVQGKVTPESAIEEFMHLFVDTLSVERKALYLGLLRQAEANFPLMATRIAIEYSDENGFSKDDRDRELISKALADAYMRERENRPSGIGFKDFLKLAKEFFKWVTGKISKAFNIELEDLPANATIGEIATLLNVDGIQFPYLETTDVRFNVESGKEVSDEFEENDLLSEEAKVLKKSIKDIKIERAEDQIKRLEFIRDTIKFLNQSRLSGALAVVEGFIKRTQQYIDNVLVPGVKTVSVSKFAGKPVLGDVFAKQAEAAINYGIFHHYFYEQLMMDALYDNKTVGDFIRDNPDYFENFYNQEIENEDGTTTTFANKYLNYTGLTYDKMKRDVMKVVDIIAADNLQGILIPEVTIYGYDSLGRAIDGRLDYIIIRPDGTIIPKDFKTHKSNQELKIYNDVALNAHYLKGRLADGVHPYFESIPHRSKYSDHLTQISIYSRLLKQGGFKSEPGSIISIIYYPQAIEQTATGSRYASTWMYGGVQVADVPVVGNTGLMMNRDEKGNITADLDPRYERILNLVKDALPIEGEDETVDPGEEAINELNEYSKLPADTVSQVLTNLREKINSQLEQVKKELANTDKFNADEEKIKVLKNRRSLLNEARILFDNENKSKPEEITPDIILRSVLEKTYELVDKLENESKEIYKKALENKKKTGRFTKEEISDLTTRHSQLNDLINFLTTFNEILVDNGFTAESILRKEVNQAIEKAADGQRPYIDLANEQIVTLLLKVNSTLAERMMESMEQYYKLRKNRLERIVAGDADVFRKGAFWLGGKVNKVFNAIINTPETVTDDMKKAAEEELKKIAFWEKNKRYDRAFVEMYVNNTFKNPESGFYIGSTITPRSTSWSGDDFVSSFGNSELAIAAMASYGIHMNEIAKDKFFDEMEKRSIDLLYKNMAAKYGSYEAAVAAVSQQYEQKDLRTGESQTYSMFLTPHQMSYIAEINARDFAVNNFREQLRLLNEDANLSDDQKTEKRAEIEKKLDEAVKEQKRYYLEESETKMLPEVYALEITFPAEIQRKIDDLKDQIKNKLNPINAYNDDFGLQDSIIDDVQQLEYEISVLTRQAIEDNPDLQESFDKYAKYYEYDVNYSGFEYQKNWMINKWGQDSPQYKAWLKYNSDLIPSSTWYERIGDLLDEKAAIFGNGGNPLWEEKKELIDKYKFKSRFSVYRTFNPMHMSEEDYQRLVQIEDELENPEGGQPVQLTKEEWDRVDEINNELRAIRTTEPKSSYVREFTSRKDALIKLKLDYIKAGADPAKADEADRARVAFENGERDFKVWYDRNNKSMYELGTIAIGGSVSMDPRSFNTMKVPTDKSLMIRVPSSRWRTRSYKPEAYNPNYSPLLGKRLYHSGSYPSPKGIKYDRETGRYIVDPKSKWANPRYVAMMQDPAAMDFYNKTVMDLYINKQVNMSAQKLGHFYPSVTQAGFDSVAQDGWSGLKREWNETLQNIKLYESSIERDTNEFGLLSNSRVRFPHNSLWTADLTTKDGLNAILKWNLSYEINQSMEEANLLMSPAIDFLEAKKKTLQDTPQNQIIGQQIDKVIDIWKFERDKFIYGQMMRAPANAEGGSNVANRKTLKNLMGIVSWSRLAFDPAMQVGNLISGNVQAYLAGEVEQNGVGGTKNLAWAKAQMYSPGGFFYKVIENWGELSGVNLETKILRFFNPTMKDYDRLLDVTGRSKMRRLLTRAFNVKDIAFVIQDKGEMEIAMTTMLKNLDAHKYNVFATDAQGNFILDENGNKTYKRDGSGNIVQVTAYQALVNGPGAIPGIRPDVDMQYKDLQAIKSVTYTEYLKFQGNYSTYMKPKVESSMAGLLMTFFRKYLVPAVESRFKGAFGVGDPKNWTGGRIQVGWWTAVGQIALYGEKGTLTQALLPGFVSKAFGLNKLDTFYKSKAMQLRREIVAAILFTIAYATVRGMVYNDDDDEEKELGWAALQGMRVIAKVSNETRSLMWLPAIGKADDYITNFSTFTTAFNEAKVFFSLFTNLFWYVTAGVFDWEYAKEMGFYEKRTTRYEEGQPKALANLVKLSGVENMLDIFNPEPSVKELYKKKQ